MNNHCKYIFVFYPKDNPLKKLVGQDFIISNQVMSTKLRVRFRLLILFNLFCMAYIFMIKVYLIYGFTLKYHIFDILMVIVDILALVFTNLLI